MHIIDEQTLPSGVEVVNFTHNTPDKIDNAYSFCFGYIFNTLWIGDVHHAQIMNYLTEDLNHGWDEMFEAPQRWGWVSNKNYGYRGAEPEPAAFDVRFSTDDALQTAGLADDVLNAFRAYYNREFTTSSERGHTTQDSYGQRTKVQYQGEEDESQAYCPYCDEYYDPDWEAHYREQCNICGSTYCEHGDPHHVEDHPECPYCDERYDETDHNEVEEHGKPFSYDSYEHFDHDDDDNYYREDTTLTHRVPENVVESMRKYIESNPGWQEEIYLDKFAETYNVYRRDLTPYLKEALNPFSDQGFARPEDAAKQYYNEGLSQGWQPDAARSQLIGYLMRHYPKDKATEIADKAIAETGGQMPLFAKQADLWVDDEQAINRGIHDITDYMVFAQLAMKKLAAGGTDEEWNEWREAYGDWEDSDDRLDFPQGEFRRLPDPQVPGLPETPANPSPGLTEAPGTPSEPLQYPGPEDLTLLDIEANPLSTEFRWSYDGHDLHIWQVTNRKMWGPSHYDMFGNEGYDEHSQGRVYISPDGQIGSLYWQISHPETEDVINQWIETTYHRPADTVYRAYGPYKGYKTPRSYFPLVDVYGLPIKQRDRWWEIPGARPDEWYYDQGMMPPTKRRQKILPEIKRNPSPDFFKKTPPEDPDPKDLSKRERRRLRRQKNKNKGQSKPNRGRRFGNFNIITYDYSPMEDDAVVQKFVFDPEGYIVSQETPDHMYSGAVHHQDLWGDLGSVIERGDLSTPNNGFLAHQALHMGGYDLRPGDVWFHQTPTAEEMQKVKEHFGNVKRIRWFGLNDESGF